MHRRFWSGTATLVVAAVFAVSLAAPASARIQCQGNFQVTKYGLLATPYCQELEIARVARSYGANVTDAESANPLTTARGRGDRTLRALAVFPLRPSASLFIQSFRIGA